MDGGTGRLEIRVGILVVLGLFLTVLLILVSDRFSFDGRYQVTVYLDDASGLNVGSPVKRDGLKIGQISSISAWQDPQGRGSIKVTAEIDRNQTIDAEATLVRKTEGIFGDGHLSFANPPKPSGRLLPQDGSAEAVASGSFLDEATDQIGTIVEGVANVLDEENQRNIKRILQNGGDVLEEGVALVRDLRQRSQQIGVLAEKTELLIVDVTAHQAELSDKASVSLDELTLALKDLREEAKAVGDSTEELAQAATAAMRRAEGFLAQGEGVLADNRADLKTISAQFAALAENLRRVSADIQQGRGVIGQLIVNQEMAKEVNDIVITAEQFAERVANNPTILVWGSDDAEIDMARDHRDQRKLRRAFMEGFDRNPPLQLDAPSKGRGRTGAGQEPIGPPQRLMTSPLMFAKQADR